MKHQQVLPFKHQTTNPISPIDVPCMNEQGLCVVSLDTYFLICPLKATEWIICLLGDQVFVTEIIISCSLIWVVCKNENDFAVLFLGFSKSQKHMRKHWYQICLVGEELPPKEMERLILSTGKKPHQRTTLYGDAPQQQRLRAFSALPLIWRGYQSFGTG